MNHVRSFATVVRVVAVLLGAVAHAGAGTREIEVVGEAAIVDGDLAAARGHARIDARVRAVEQAAGIVLDARTDHLDDLFATSSVRTRAVGAILEERVLEEWSEGGMLRLRVRARVSDDRLLDEFVRLVEADRVAVVATIEGGAADGSLRDAAIAEASARLTEQGFRDVETVPGRSIAGLDAAVRLGAARGADAVVVLSVRLGEARHEGGGLWTAGGSGHVTLFRVRQKRQATQVTAAGIRGFGDDRTAAEEHAVRSGVATLLTDLGAAVLPEEYRLVRVEILGIPDVETFERVRGLLAAQRFVESVETDALGYHPRKTVFLVRGRQDAVLLGVGLDRRPEFEVQEAGIGGLQIRYVR